MLTLHGQPAEGRGPYHLDDLMVALQAAYFQEQAVGMTIDPDPKDPRGPVMIVRYFGGCQDTALGWVLFECDRLLKSLSNGEDSLAKTPLKPDVPDFFNMLQLGQALGVPERQWNRFWLTTDVEEGPTWHERPKQSNRYQPVLLETADGKAVSFLRCRLYLRTEVMELQDGKMVPVKGGTSKTADRFAKHFSVHYDEFAQRFPEFRRADALARLIVLAEWIVKAEIPLDVEYIRSYRQQYPVRTPQLTPATTVSLTSTEKVGDRIGQRTIRGYGGVDLQPRTFFANDQDGAAAHYRQAADEGLTANPRNLTFQTTRDGRPEQVAVVPARDMRLPATGSSPAYSAELRTPTGKPSVPPPANLPPRSASVAKPEKSERVIAPQITITTIDQYRAQPRGPPDAAPIEMRDGRFVATADTGETLVWAQVTPLAELIAMGHGPRPPPATETSKAKSIAGVDTSESVIPPKTPLISPTKKPAAGQTSPTAKPAYQPGSDTSEKIISSSTPLTAAAPRLDWKAMDTTTKVSPAKNNPWAFPLFLSSSSTTTYNLPRLVTHFDPHVKREVGVQGRPETNVRVFDQLALMSEIGDILVQFGPPAIDQDRVVVFYPPNPPAAYGLVGYYPQSKTLEFRDGMRVEFNDAGHPQVVNLPDQTRMEFAYEKSGTEKSSWPRPIACRVAAANDRAQSGIYRLTEK